MHLLHALLEQSAIRYSDRGALLFKGDLVSYAELNIRANQLARLLVFKGLRVGDRVGIYFEKGLEQAVAIWAVAKAGGVFVVLNPTLKDSAVRYIIEDCDMTVLITAAAKLKLVSLDGLPSLKIGICEHLSNLSLPEDIHWFDWSEAQKQSSENLQLSIDEQSLAAIIYTSGSTGMPKGVMLTHSNITLGAHAVGEYLQISCNDRILSLLPFSFDYGLNQMTTAVKEGALLVLKNYIFPEEIIEIIHTEKITGLAGIPTIWIQLLQAKNVGKYSTNHFRYMTNSGDRLSVTHVRALEQAFPHTKIYLMYGLTEAFRATYLNPAELGRRPDSIGKAIPHAEIFVINAQGKETEPHETGELIQAGPLVSKGYWGKPEATAEKIKPHPLKKNGGFVCYSGDLVRRDEDGFLYYVGRNSAMIKSLGHRISPTEIESELYKLSSVKQAVAFCVKD